MSLPKATRDPDLSVIIPVAERPAPLGPLYEEYSRSLRAAGLECEFIFSLAQWHEPLARELEALAARGEPVRVLQVTQAAGDATLLRVAVERARAPVLLALPAYRRIEARDLPRIVQPVFDEVDMTVARRWPRRDSLLNRLQNRVFHGLLRLAGGRQIHDTASGVLAFRRQVFDALPLYGDFHRFLPVLAMREGFVVEEVEAEQHPSDRGSRIYSPGVYLRRMLDLLGLFFLVRFMDKPLRFFGLVGIVSALIGTALMVVLVVDRTQGQAIADRPLLLLGTLLLVLGAQAIALGLVGEIVVHLHAPRRRPYRLLEAGASKPDPSESESTRGAGAGGPTGPRSVSESGDPREVIGSPRLRE